jgi:O-antigen/teichoic acid export membrane protein
MPKHSSNQIGHTPTPLIPSIQSRYLSKVFNTVASGILTIIAMPLVSRALGPSGLGQFDYASESMKLLINFFSFGIPMAVFTWQARESAERAKAGLIAGMGLWFLTGLLALSFVMISQALGKSEVIWPKTALQVLLLGLLLQFITSGQLFVTQWGDARALTKVSEKSKTVLNVARLVGVVALYYSASLELDTYFGLQILTALGFILITGAQLWRLESTSSGLQWDKKTLQEFFSFARSFSMPLIFGSFIQYFSDYISAWILQYYSGNEERGFFGLATRVGQIIFVFAGALTAIFMREIAIAFKAQDLGRIRHLFEQSRLLIFLTAAISIFSAVNSVQLVHIFGGAEFAGGTIALTLMCLYPTHQVLGQLTTSFFLASGETRFLTIFSSITSIVTLPLSYFILAGKGATLPGFELGAMGRALLMVTLQLFTTNTLLYFICSRVHMRFSSWLLYQVKIIAGVTVAAILSKELSTLLNSVHSLQVAMPGMLNILTSLVLYALFLFVFVLIVPSAILPFNLKELRRRFNDFFAFRGGRF